MLLNSQGPLTKAFAVNGNNSFGAGGQSSSSRLGDKKPHPLTSLLNANRSPLNAASSSRRSSPLITIQHGNASTPPKQAHVRHNTNDLALVAHSIRGLLSPTTSPTTNTSLEHLYNTVEHLVTVTGQGSELYEKLQEEAERATVEVARVLKSNVSQDSLAWLNVLQGQWKGWLTRTETVRSLMSHLDADYVRVAQLKRQDNVKPSLDLLMIMFKHHVLDDEQIREKALSSITQLINAERINEASSSSTKLPDATIPDIAYHSLHPLLVSLFMRLQAYGDLQTAILDSARQFYEEEASKWIRGNSSSETEGEASTRVRGISSWDTEIDHVSSPIDSYLKHIEGRLAEETSRAQWLLQASEGRQKLVAAVRDELVRNHVDWLTAGLSPLLEQEAPPIGSLSLLFQHLDSVGHLKTLSAAFVVYMVKVGSAIVYPPASQAASKIRKPGKTEQEKILLRNAMADEEKVIDQLLSFKAKVDSTVDVAFRGHDEFKQKRKEALEKVVNSRNSGNKVAELCAKYLDMKLRQGNRAMSDEELQRCLDEALVLFRSTHAKDMFEGFYKDHFAKRLLLNKSASTDFESMMLLRLKDECGPAFTQRLETMLKDITLSDDLMKAYSERQAKEQEPIDSGGKGDVDPFDMHVNVLTQAHWPTYPVVNVQIPASMARASQRFETFYGSRTSGRKLFWCHAMGTCVLRAQFKTGSKELHVSEFQAIVLMLFNDVADERETLTYASIAEQTGLEEKELKRTLQSLACGKINTRVLRKEPQSREIDTSKDEFYFNRSLQNEHRRITVNQIQIQETIEEQESTESRVLLDRELVLQASIVRIMKSKKKVKHNELLQLVVDSIKNRFQIDVGEIKKQFEILIEKEYMERDEDDRTSYTYLA
ncbi:unnamed protein product [Sympodiomycopsis kandeliae]